MRIPRIIGLIERRILVNYRVALPTLAALLPAPFRPKPVGEFGIAGICLIRLKGIRPAFLPRWFGLSSENAAHRVAVQWEQDGVQHEGVYIPRRDTSSRLNTLVGGRVFSGVHHHAAFAVEETEERFRVQLHSDDGVTHVQVDACRSKELPADSAFDGLSAASAFFENGSLGYSDSARPGEFEGLELRMSNWEVEPLGVTCAKSSYFDDPERFPPGTVNLDFALLMQQIEHEWCQQPRLCRDSLPNPE